MSRGVGKLEEAVNRAEQGRSRRKRASPVQQEPGAPVTPPDCLQIGAVRLWNQKHFGAASRPSQASFVKSEAMKSCEQTVMTHFGFPIDADQVCAPVHTQHQVYAKHQRSAWCHIKAVEVCMVPHQSTRGLHGATSKHQRSAWCHIKKLWRYVH